jgi:hypothetical protein
VVVLALIHHLVISRNVPLENLASLLSKICRRWLIIEFVAKEDERVSEILERKEDIFPNYHPAGFEKIFSSLFTCRKKADLKQGNRILYLFEKKGRACVVSPTSFKPGPGLFFSCLPSWSFTSKKIIQDLSLTNWFGSPYYCCFWQLRLSIC